MRCDCGALVFEGDVTCSECGRELSIAPRRAEPPVEQVPLAQVEAVEPDPVPADAPRCAEHPDQLSRGTCARCGRFCCAACLPDAWQKNCPACQRRLRVEQNPVELKRLRRELTVAFFFAALVISGLGVLLPLFMGNPRVSWIAGGVALALLQLLAAVLFLARPRAAAAWLGVAVEGAAAAILAATIGPNCVTVVLALFPLMTGWRIVKWSSLEREAAELARAGA